MSDVAGLDGAAAAVVAARPLHPGEKRILRDLVLYGLCSAAALAADWLLLVILVRWGVPPAVAAAAGFFLGLAVAYLTSITFVFADRRTGSWASEALIFAAVGIAGLGLTEVLLRVFAERFGLSAPVAKAPTAVMVFLFNFALRRTLLFARPAP